MTPARGHLRQTEGLSIREEHVAQAPKLQCTHDAGASRELAGAPIRRPGRWLRGQGLRCLGLLQGTAMPELHTYLSGGGGNGAGGKGCAVGGLTAAGGGGAA